MTGIQIESGVEPVKADTFEEAVADVFTRLMEFETEKRHPGRGVVAHDLVDMGGLHRVHLKVAGHRFDEPWTGGEAEDVAASLERGLRLAGAKQFAPLPVAHGVERMHVQGDLTSGLQLRALRIYDVMVDGWLVFFDVGYRRDS